MARFVGTNGVIVTEDVKGEETSLKRITSINSTDAAVVTGYVLFPVASRDTRWLQDTSIKSTFVSIITLGSVNTFWIGRWTSSGSTDLVSNGVVWSQTSSSTISGVLGDSVGSGLISIITVTGAPGGPVSKTRGWTETLLCSGTRVGSESSISEWTRGSSITSWGGNTITISLVSRGTVTSSIGPGTNARNRADWSTWLGEQSVVLSISTVDSTKR